MKQMELGIVVKREGGNAVAPAQYANIGRECVDEIFPGRWIGRDRRR
jgi:hypothetical protein